MAIGLSVPAGIEAHLQALHLLAEVLGLGAMLQQVGHAGGTVQGNIVPGCIDEADVAVVAPVAPGVIFKSSFSMSDMIVRSYDISGFQEFYDHVQVSSGMLAESVDNLDDSLWSGSWNIYPAIDFVTFIEGFEFYFV